MNMDTKLLNINLKNIIYQYLRRIMLHDQVGFIPKRQDWLNILKSINKVYHTIKIKDKRLIFISINSEVQHQFMIL